MTPPVAFSPYDYRARQGPHPVYARRRSGHPDP
jgi:hypothetical protein